MKRNLNDYVCRTGKDLTISLADSEPYSGCSADEIQLVERWKGEHPIGIARLMCDEFKRGYPDWEEVFRHGAPELDDKEECLEGLVVPSTNTWPELERNLRTVARRFVTHRECLEYWDQMRTIWRYLVGDRGQAARQKKYRFLDKKDSLDKDCPIIDIGHCHLCWRAVPRRLGQNSNLFCPTHTFGPDASRHPEYRKRKRMLSKVLSGLKGQGILFSTPVQRMASNFAPYREEALSVVSDAGGDGEGHYEEVTFTWDDIWYGQPEVLIRRLPHVYDYLKEKGVSLDSAAEIIQGLEEPFGEDEKEDAVQARKKFYEASATYLNEYYERLALAEIWLRLESIMIHGGKREGAGRPKIHS